jgi:hypothetical protein
VSELGSPSSFPHGQPRRGHRRPAVVATSGRAGTDLVTARRRRAGGEDAAHRGGDLVGPVLGELGGGPPVEVVDGVVEQLQPPGVVGVGERHEAVGALVRAHGLTDVPGLAEELPRPELDQPRDVRRPSRTAGRAAPTPCARPGGSRADLGGEAIEPTRFAPPGRPAALRDPASGAVRLTDTARLWTAQRWAHERPAARRCAVPPHALDDPRRRRSLRRSVGPIPSGGRRRSAAGEPRGRMGRPREAPGAPGPQGGGT